MWTFQVLRSKNGTLIKRVSNSSSFWILERPDVSQLNLTNNVFSAAYTQQMSAHNTTPLGQLKHVVYDCTYLVGCQECHAISDFPRELQKLFWCKRTRRFDIRVLIVVVIQTSASSQKSKQIPVWYVLEHNHDWIWKFNRVINNRVQICLQG